MTVRALAKTIGMSYMGVKKPCLDLTRQGYLVAVRHPRPLGRPELLYRLSEKGHDLFPASADDLSIALLHAARELFGPTAPGKLIFVFFRDKEKHYASRIRGREVIQRARWFAREREKEGYVISIQGGERGTPFLITERHNPLAALMEEYPETSRMETDMIERLLGAPTRLEPAPGASRFARSFRVTPQLAPELA